MPLRNSYRLRFQSADAASRYELNVIGESSHAQLLWPIERALLTSVIEQLGSTPSDVECLDFACGSGRILAFLETVAGTCTGIDVSPAMLALARERVERSTLTRADITDPEVAVEGLYDLITAFRFFVNAEPALQVSVLKQLSLRLRDGQSRAVFAIHSHLPSHKILQVLWRSVRRIFSPAVEPRNFLTRRQFTALLRDADLVIVDKLGYDLLSSKLAPVLGPERLMRVEQRMAGGRIANRLGGHQIYVVRKAGPACDR